MSEYEYEIETLRELIRTYEANHGVKSNMNYAELIGLFDTGIIQETSSVERWTSDTTPELSLYRQLFIQLCLMRHVSGDWGNVCIEDFLENERSLIHGFRIMSVYRYKETFDSCEVTLWIITEYDHSRTTVLFPCDY